MSLFVKWIFEIKNVISMYRLIFIILVTLVLTFLVFYSKTTSPTQYKFRTENSNYTFSFTTINRVEYKTLEKFEILHRRIMSGKSKLKLSINGYTIAGYANKLYSMLTSMTIALLTDSAIIIRWKIVDLYIKEPFHKAFQDFSNQQNGFDAEFNKSNIFYANNARQAWAIKKNMLSLIQTKLPDHISDRFLYNDISPYFFELCSNPIYYEKLHNYGLVSLETMRKAFEITKNMSAFDESEQSDNILKVGFEVGGNLLNRMWKPNDNISAELNHFVETLFKDYFMIGIQLRYEYINDEKDTQKFVDCALEIEENATSLEEDFKTNYKGVKWFVTSDSEGVLNRLKSGNYSNKIVTGSGRMGHIEQDANAYKRAILDVELLAKCNELIITGGSTYGFVSAMKSLKLPFYVNGGGKMSKCVRTGLSRPSITNTGYAVY